MLQERAAARGVKLPGKAASDPKDLGKVLTDLHEKPGQLRDILGPGDAESQGQAPDRILLQTCCRPRWPRPCSRASQLAMA
jgi:hypothetical protein